MERFVLLFLFAIFHVSSGFVFDNNSRLKRQGGQCRTPTGREGSCIKITECKPLLDLLTSNKNDPSVRQQVQAFRCGYSNDDVPKVCCTQPNFNPPTSDEKFPKQCGKNGQTIPTNNIVNGTPSKLRAWPWMALLGYKSKDGRKIIWRCGGALVNNRAVVTAAHCLAAEVVVARLGELDYERDDDGANHKDVQTQSQKMHEQYDSEAGIADIGIVYLKTPVPFSADIQPICLPSSQQWKTKNYIGYNPFVAGWGTLEYYGSSSSHLMEAQVEVQDVKVCREKFGALRTDPSKRPKVIDERNLCAGGGRTDSCQGDSGGPLMMLEGGSFYLFGVVSYGYKCAEEGYPGVYTKVSHYIDWVSNNV